MDFGQKKANRFNIWHNFCLVKNPFYNIELKILNK